MANIGRWRERKEAGEGAERKDEDKGGLPTRKAWRRGNRKGRASNGRGGGEEGVRSKEDENHFRSDSSKGAERIQAWAFSEAGQGGAKGRDGKMKAES